MHVSNNWNIEDRDGLKLIFSPVLSSIPGVVHAFTTRIGGSSPEPLEHFNLGGHWPAPELKQDAIANRKRLCQVLGLDPLRLVMPGQVHSVEVHWVTEPGSFPVVDGLATLMTNIPLLVHFADCVPIILVDVKHRAVSVIHAGWRGTAGSIANRGVALLQEATGVSPKDIVAAIGPAIGSCCYPTSQAVAEQLASTVSDTKELIAFCKDSPCPDLKAINARQLSEAGVREIDISSYCTACHPKLFYSHRQSGGKTGRQGAIACLKIMVLIVIQLLLPTAQASTPITPNTSTPKASKDKSGLRLYPLTPILDTSNDNQKPRSAKGSGQPTTQLPSTSQNQISYPDIDQLEQITFGYIKPNEDIQERLSELEMTVLHQSFLQQSIKMRSLRLNDALLGSSSNMELTEKNTSKKSDEEETDSRWQLPEYQIEMPVNLLEQDALKQLNQEREQQGLKHLEWDELAAKIARTQVKDMCNRNIVSHFDQEGRSPDLRYTISGGSDAITESVLMLPGAQQYKKNRALIGRILTILNKRQDDRDALLSPDATHFGFSFATTAKKDRLVVCAEVITRHAIMHSIPSKITLKEKIEVKGVMLKPYHFDRVTLAWEGLKRKYAQTADESDEALPYFSPLDFIAYGVKAEHRDHEKALMILRTAGMIAALAGGFFIPPVALAAPLIALSGTSTDEPHPVSEIPVHGGIKLEGSLFHGDIPLNNSDKPGMYYVTVWASNEQANKPIPVSRRIVMVTEDLENAAQVKVQNRTVHKKSEEKL